MPATPRSHSAAELLRTYDLSALIQMARTRGLEYKGMGKEALVKLLAKQLYAREAIERALEDLEPAERAMLDLVILAGGEVATNVVRDQLFAEGQIEGPLRAGWSVLKTNATGSPTSRGSKKLADVVARLGLLGLVFTTNAGHASKTLRLGALGQYLFIPDAIVRHLPPITISLETAEAPANERISKPDAFLRDIYLLVSFAQKQPIPLTTKGQILKRLLVQIDESLCLPEGAAAVKSEAELGRLPLLRAVAEQLGLLTPAARGLALGEAPMSFFSLPRGERLGKMYDAYCQTQRWSELARLQHVLITPRERLAAPHIVAARKRVLQEIAELPAGGWISMDHLVDRIRKRAFEFLFPRDWNASSYAYYGYTPDPYGGANPLQLTFTPTGGKEAPTSWETVEAEVIRVVIVEPLYWLGLVDLGSQTEEGPSAFRITEAGAALLRGKTPPSGVENPNVIIQPNFQIFALEPTGEDVLFALDGVAVRVRADQVAEYRLTRESVYAARRRGMEVSEILGFLQRVSSVPLPQNVRRSLEDWGAQLERIVFRRNVSMVQGVDEQTLDALYADPELSRLLGRRVAPTAALVPADRLQSVFGRLLDWTDRRILPAVSDGDDGLDRRAVDVNADGRVIFQQRLPSIYLRAALRPFTEEEEHGSLRLTPRSLQRAATARSGKGESYSADEILERLTRVSVEPLPEEVIALVRRWARDWGRGTLADVTLLGVETVETMKDLQADDEIGEYLHPIPGAPTLAVVKGEHAEKVREILLERGMDLGNRLIDPK